MIESNQAQELRKGERSPVRIPVIRIIGAKPRKLRGRTAISEVSQSYVELLIGLGLRVRAKGLNPHIFL